MEISMESVKILTAICLLSGGVQAEDVPITGTVQSRCQITTDIPGVYGNPNAYTLSTAPSDGGVVPIVRYDVSLADAYLARVSHPTEFSSSPNLNDVVTFTGSTEVSSIGDAGMSGYEAAKTTFDNTTQYDLTEAGSTWFKTTSTAVNGGNKAFPGGTYRAVVVAECIAK
jgi:hypothetical protein